MRRLKIAAAIFVGMLVTAAILTAAAIYVTSHPRLLPVLIGAIGTLGLAVAAWTVAGDIAKPL